MIATHQQAAKKLQEEYTDHVSDRSLWAAVLLQALEDWQSSNRRLKDEAEEFFFQADSDFAMVCQGAGFEPASVLGKLRNMKRLSPARPLFQLPLVA